MVRRRRPNPRGKKKSMEFLWPFLIIIFVGIILILFIQFVMSWFDQRQTDLKNKMYLYLDQGDAEILAWGDTEWTRAYHGQLVLEGDMLAMKRSSRGFLEFFNDGRLRLDGEAKIEVDEIVTDSDGDEIHVELRTGNVWFNLGSEEDVVKSIVYLDNIRVTSYDSIFEVSITDRETVRVLDGEVLVEVLEQDSDRDVVLEQFKVGIGQQVELTSSDMEKIMARQPVSLLEALDDEWKSTSWYVWNVGEDTVPTEFDPGDMDAISVIEVTTEVEVIDEIITDEVVEEEETEEVEEEEVVEEEEEEEESEEADVVVPTLTITSPSESPHTLAEGETSFAVVGAVSENTEKVIVTSYDADGNAFDYVLGGYTAGDLTWQYNAAEGYGNLREGRNLFSVVAENGSGLQSDPVEVIIEVAEGTFEDEEETEEETEDIEEVSETDESEEVEEEDSSEEEAVSTDPLTTPEILTLNGEAYSGTYTTALDSVAFVGTVSVSAVSVYVNEYELTSYVSGSGNWTYNARTDFNNYEVGDNSYDVYSMDAEGNKSVVLVIDVYYEAP
jgi:hypothetical protein